MRYANIYIYIYIHNYMYVHENKTTKCKHHTHLRHSQPSSVHLFNERFSQKCHIHVRFRTIGICVSIDETLVGRMGLAPALVLSSVGWNERIFASTRRIVSSKTPMTNISCLEIVLTVYVGPIVFDDAHLGRRIQQVHEAVSNACKSQQS